MKTSKILLLSLFLSVALLILAAFIDIRLTARKGPGGTELETHSIEIPDFSVLVISNTDLVSIKQTGAAKLELLSRKGEDLPDFNYQVNQDTLKISRPAVKGELLFVNINVLKPFRTIIADNSDVRIQKEHGCNLTIKADRSKIFISCRETGPSNESIEIFAKNHSRVTSTAFTIDSLGIFAENSIATLSARPGQLYGSSASGSYVSASQPSVVNFRCDSSSKFLINPYNR